MEKKMEHDVDIQIMYSNHVEVGIRIALSALNGGENTKARCITQSCEGNQAS